MKVKTVVSFFVVLPFLLVCCQKPAAEKTTPEPRAKDTVHVEAAALQKQKVTEGIRTSAVVQGIQEAVLSVEVPGRVRRVAVVPGSFVKKGSQTLILDEGASGPELEGAKAVYLQALARLKTVKALSADGNASDTELQSAEAGERSAKAALARAQSHRQKNSLTAPISGFVVNTFVRAGEYLGPGTPALKLSDIRTLKVKSYLGETQVVKLKKGKRVNITFSAFPELVLNGRVKAIGAGLDERAGGYPVEVHFKNTPDLKIKSGMNAHLTFVAKVFHAVLVPQIAVLERQGGKAVFQIENGQARLALVSLGQRREGGFELLSGVAPGTVVALSRLAQLENGTPVQTYMETAE